MTSRPSVTTTRRPNPNQPSTMAAVPTPLFTLPFPRSCAIVLAATAAVCCHMTETRTKTEAINIVAKATCETGLDGKGLTSLSEPSADISSCHPGNVARRMNVRNARTMAMMLESVSQRALMERVHLDLHEIWKDDGVFEGLSNPDQIQRVLIHRHQICKC